MKKFGLFLCATLALLLQTSCQKEFDGPDKACVVTVRTMSVGSDYYFEADTGRTIYPSDKSRIGTYEAKEGQRAVITFKTLAPISGYDINAQLYTIGDLFTGDARIVSDPEELAALSDDPVQLRTAGSYITSKYLTLYVVYPVLDNSKHRFELIVDNTKTAAKDPDYLDVELRHDAGGEVGNTYRETYISFNIEALSERLAGMEGIALRVKESDSSIKTYKIDFSPKIH